MAFDADVHLASLMNYPLFLAKPNILSEVSWENLPGSGGEIVMTTYGDDGPTPARFAVVGQVSYLAKSVLNPTANLSVKDADEIHKTKWCFTVEYPEHFKTFAAPYLAQVDAARTIQEKGAKSDKHSYWLSGRGDKAVFRFVASMFRKKHFPHEDQAVKEAGASDTPGDKHYFPTAINWPAEHKHQPKFDSALVGHIFLPFNVSEFKDGSWVHPAKIETRLPGSLVEVIFTLRHYNFGNGDVFTAEVETVQILDKPTPVSTPATPTARRHFRSAESPVKPNVFERTEIKKKLLEAKAASSTPMASSSKRSYASDASSPSGSPTKKARSQPKRGGAVQKASDTTEASDKTAPTGGSDGLTKNASDKDDHDSSLSDLSSEA